MIARSCDCEPTGLLGDGDVPEHAEECPRRHGHVHTAGDVSRARMFRSAAQQSAPESVAWEAYERALRQAS